MLRASSTMGRLAFYVRLTWALLVPAACSAGDPALDHVTSRDSAGVTITEVDVVPWEATEHRQLTAQPVLEIGVQQGDSVYELYQVNAAVRLSDGGVAISNAGTSEIRVYARDGRFVRAIGRSGGGPGEFGALGGVEVLGEDSLLAIDLARSAVMAFSIDGTPAWTRHLDVAPCFWLAEEGPARTRLANGSFMVVCEMDDVWSRIRAGTTRPGATDRSRAAILHFDPAGLVPDTVAFAPAIEYGIVDGADGRPGTMYPPWGHRLAWAVGPADILVGSQDVLEIRRYAVDGRLESIIRGPGRDLTITPADLESLRQAMVGRARGNDAEAQRFADEYLSTYPRPDRKPASGRILLDTRGGIWISEPYHALETPVRWGILGDPAGTVASLEVPERFEVFEVGPDWILGRYRDESDVEFVRLYGVSQAGR
jgi:6-bladed beta-propeller